MSIRDQLAAAGLGRIGAEIEAASEAWELLWQVDSEESDGMMWATWSASIS